MKKVLALALAATMALGMTVTSFAADKATDFSGNLAALVEAKYQDKVEGQTINLDTIRPVDEVKVKFDLDRTAFGLGGSGVMSAAEIRASKIKVNATSKAGSKLLSSLEVVQKDGQVVAKFVKEMVSTKSADFEIEIYLTIDGKRKGDQSATLIGTMENEVISVYDNYDYVDLSNKLVAEAEDFINNIEVDLGNGVSIFTKFFKGKKYYGTASRDADEADDVVFKQYPDIDNVVTLKTVGLNSTGDIVKLDNDYDNYYVYDKDMNFLGMSNEMLPYSSKYYLANKELDVEVDEDIDEEAPEVEDEEGDNASTGGDADFEENANFNPGTGR